MCRSNKISQIIILVYRDVWGNKLELGFPRDSDGFLVRGASLIGKNLEVNGKATRRQSRHDGVVGRNPMPVIPIGVGQAIKRVAVSCFDRIEPCLLDWKAKAVEADHGTYAGEVNAARG
jgi:hypothetical protein